MATANAIRSAYDQRLAPLGLTLSVASLLSYIRDFGPVSQTVPPSTSTRVAR
jgi:hypothetical protein